MGRGFAMEPEYQGNLRFWGGCKIMQTSGRKWISRGIAASRKEKALKGEIPKADPV